MSFISNRVQARFTSDLVEVSNLEPLFAELLKGIPIESKRHFDIMVSVSEAFNNAIRHGNKYDPTKYVVIKAGVCESLLWCRISDQGLGFDENEVPDPLKGDNILKENGRGVFLIKELSTACNFSKTNFGYQVDMVFSLNQQLAKSNDPKKK